MLGRLLGGSRVIALAVVLMAAVVWLVGQEHRVAASRAAAEIGAANAILVALLDQETGLRGYVNGRERVFLEPYATGRRDFEVALARALDAAQAGEPRAVQAVERQERIARRWQAHAEDLVARVGRGETPARPRLLAGKELMDRFRAANAAHTAAVVEQAQDQQRSAQRLSVVLIVLLGVLIGGSGYLLVDRPLRLRERAQRRLARFADLLQTARDEQESYDMLGRFVQQVAPASQVVVLRRNNSDDRLEACTELEPDSQLARRLDGAAPDSCLAIRLASSQTHGRGVEEALPCRLCGGDAESACIPTLVGGQVTGAVLMTGPQRIAAAAVETARQGIAQAAPVIANLRSRDIAERRAYTDALTGLPNSRAVQDALKQMAAMAGRSKTPLAAVLLDLDRFKQINDTFGHDRGDAVLAAVGVAIGETVRGSDFAGRYGGEEFVLLLPDTGRQGALVVAGKLRDAISRLQVPGVPRAITASFGVAVLPDQAGDADTLMRLADRAMYSAKAAGRNRVAALDRDRSRRLDSLHRSGLLDSAPEERFDRITRLAAETLGAETALLSLVDEDRQFFKSACGLSGDLEHQRQTPISHSFCRHAVEAMEPLIVPDARKHPLLCDNPAILEYDAIAYAGIPLINSDGHALGTLCVLDSRPRAWTIEDRALLEHFAAQATRELEGGTARPPAAVERPTVAGPPQS